LAAVGVKHTDPCDVWGRRIILTILLRLLTAAFGTKDVHRRAPRSVATGEKRTSRAESWQSKVPPLTPIRSLAGSKCRTAAATPEEEKNLDPL
jgi:hypothetical protein